MLLTPNHSTVESIYVHFPYCKHLCNYCDFYKLKLLPNERKANLLSLDTYLHQSWDLLQELFSQQLQSMGSIKSIYFGGGTPSLWGDEGIAFWKQWIKEKKINFSADYEWTMEVDPGTIDEKSLLAWSKLGVNRFSVGIQTLNPEIFPLMDRSHSLDQAHQLLALLGSHQFNFSVDFMLGLPDSQKLGRNIQQELELILQYQPKHISLYFLTVNAQYQHFEKLPQDEWTAEEFIQVDQQLKRLGMTHYEVASFAVKGFESKHNQQYWTHQSVAAMGPSATGFLAQPGLAMRYRWSNSWKEGPNFKLEPLTADELALEQIYLILRMGRAFYARQLALKIKLNGIEEVLGRWQKLGYCHLHENHGLEQSWQMTPKGWLILDTLVHDLF